MIPKEYRFHGLGSLRFVFNKGQSVRSQHCSLKYHLNNRRQKYRLAVVVSRKVHKSAVVRNKIRRRIYEYIRTHEKISQPYDLVITVYSDQLADLSPNKLAKLLHDLLQSAAVLS